MLEIGIVDYITFKYYGSISVATQSVLDQNICVDLPISVMLVLCFGGSMKGVDWQNC